MDSIITVHQYLKNKAHAVPTQSLDHRHVLVCANVHQTHLLREQLALKHGDRSAILPDILTFNQWIESSYLQEPSTHRTILSYQMQCVLWHHAVETSVCQSTDASLLWPMAKDFLKQYQGEASQRTMTQQTQDPAYLAARQAYLSLLEQQNLIDHCQMETTFTQWFTCRPAKKIAFTGFAVLTPSMQAILEHLSTEHVFYHQWEERLPKSGCVVVRDHQQQIDHLAHYLMSTACHTNEKIALVVSQNSDIDTIINPALAQIAHATPDQTQVPHVAYHVSMPLAKHPLVNHWHNLLRYFKTERGQFLLALFQPTVLQNPKHPPSSYHRVTQSLYQLSRKQLANSEPFTDDAHERAIWQQCQQLACHHVPTEGTCTQWSQWLLTLWQQHFAYYLPHDENERSLFTHWIDTITRASLPGAWQQTPIDLHQWYDLISMALEQSQVPQSFHGKIAVLPWQTAIDMRFDRLLFVNHHAGTWPPTLPVPATGTQQAQLGACLHAQLLASAQEIVFLQPQHDAQMQPLLASPLVKSQLQPHNTPKILPYYLYPKQTIKTKIPVHGPPITKAEYTISTGVLQAYSRCPAQGFFHSRCRLQSTPPAPYGLNSALMGQVVHAALQRLDDVQAHAIDDQPTRLQVIDEVLQKQPGLKLSQPQRQSLTEHLERLLLQWLNHRLEAHAEETLQSSKHEVALSVERFGLTFRLRLDRLDRYQDGSYRIIDYKTGMTSRADWLSKRPQHPQMIIYALCMPQTVTIAYAGLHPDQFGYSGYTQNSQDLEGIKPIDRICLSEPDAVEKIMNHWPLQMALWEKAIENLASEYRSGLMLTHPTEGQTTCSRCQWQSVCRVYERTQAQEVHS